ncbi:hypothetical protein ACPOL_2152 [Acidisarcina polymorpha]|uniref:Uncharacterized protein n=1 Tax=Acidisarcina polymorpha TaxID=2211140 RepID=A0A2Z5FYM8_9BACT|nr:hypothetical protein [Acidisarcina polymorpha]AXC11476.1 hypothetical protein ACPOL_2152 [Acidisarcina polymorpha]
MTDVAQTGLLPASQIAQQTAVIESSNGIFYGTFGDTHLTESDLLRTVQAVPSAIAKALKKHAYYFVPLTIADEEEVLIAPTYTVDLGDRAVCHRNVEFEAAEITFVSTRLMQDRFALAFEFFINASHHFVDAAGVPESFGNLVWSQAVAQVRGETSQDAWESRRRALDRNKSGDRINEKSSESRTDRVSGRKRDHASLREISAVPAEAAVDEKAKTSYFESAFSDAIAIYLLSLTIDFDYADLREREYPLIAPPALAERLRHIAELFPANAGYEFQILYRRRG